MSTEIGDAMLKQIERNDICVRVARIVDPSAFTEWWDGSGPEAKLREPDVRQRYNQSRALVKAGEILRLLAKTPDWQRQAADSEANRWRDMGVPVDLPELREIIDRKYLHAPASEEPCSEAVTHK